MATSVRMHKDLRNRVDHTIAPIVYTVDAKGRTLGRVASEAASALLGKKSVHFVKNKVLPVTVTISNAAKLSLPEKRVAEKAYTRYTGPGGLRNFTMKELASKKGMHEVIRKTVDGMLPRNKLRKERMKRLVITD
jgi:large subunit ribosomal protein L13